MDPLITIESLQKARRCSTASKAIEALAVEIRAYQRRETSSEGRLVWLTGGWISGLGGRESADLLEGAMWEFIPELEKALATIGAAQSLEYLKKLIEVCGGVLPSDEKERSELIESKYEALARLDKIYRSVVTEESAEALLQFLEVQTAKQEKCTRQAGHMGAEK